MLLKTIRGFSQNNKLVDLDTLFLYHTTFSLDRFGLFLIKAEDNKEPSCYSVIEVVKFIPWNEEWYWFPRNIEWLREISWRILRG